MSYNPYYNGCYPPPCPPPPCPPPPCPQPIPYCPIQGPQGPQGPPGPAGAGSTGPTGPPSVTIIDPISLPNHQLPPVPYSVQLIPNTNNPIPLPSTKWQAYYHIADSQSGVGQGPTTLFPWPINAPSPQPCTRQPYRIFYANCAGVTNVFATGRIDGLLAIDPGQTCAPDQNAQLQFLFQDCDTVYAFVEVLPNPNDYRPLKYTMCMYTGPRGDPTVFNQAEAQFTVTGPPPSSGQAVMPPHIMKLEWSCSAEWLRDSPSLFLTTNGGLTVTEVKILLTPSNQSSPVATSTQFIQGPTGPCCNSGGSATPVLLTHQYYPRLVDGNLPIDVTAVTVVCVPGYSYPFSLQCAPTQPYQFKMVNCTGNYIINTVSGSDILIDTTESCIAKAVGTYNLTVCVPSAPVALYGVVVTAGPSPPTLPIQVDVWVEPSFDVRDAAGNPTNDTVRMPHKFTWVASVAWLQQQWTTRGGNYVDPFAPGLDPGIPLLNPTNHTI